MLDVGGWYFDTDVYPVDNIDLDKIEKSMAWNTCLVVPMVAGMKGLEADILCCQPGWRGETAVDEYMREKRESVEYFQYTLTMIRHLYYNHPSWFTVGSANLLRNDWRKPDRDFTRTVDYCPNCRKIFI
jgi:hypothetical protein